MLLMVRMLATTRTFFSFLLLAAAETLVYSWLALSLYLQHFQLRYKLLVVMISVVLAMLTGQQYYYQYNQYQQTQTFTSRHWQAVRSKRRVWLD